MHCWTTKCSRKDTQVKRRETPPHGPARGTDPSGKYTENIRICRQCSSPWYERVLSLLAIQSYNTWYRVKLTILHVWSLTKCWSLTSLCDVLILTWIVLCEWTQHVNNTQSLNHGLGLGNVWIRLVDLIIKINRMAGDGCKANKFK